MFESKYLYDDNNNENILGDYLLEEEVFSYTNTTKDIKEVHSITIAMKTKDRLKKNSYGCDLITNGFNFYLKNSNKKIIPLFDDLQKIKTNEDLFFNGFNQESMTLDKRSNDKNDVFFYVYRFTKKLKNPLKLKKNESLQFITNDDMTRFIDHKVLIEIY